MADGRHLSPQARAALSLPVEERLEFLCSTRWIEYPRATQILDKLDSLARRPKSYRMPNLAIVGATGNGKTEIVRQFQRLNPPVDEPGKERCLMPVVIAQAPNRADESRMINRILEATFSPYKPSDNLARKEAQALQMLRYHNTKVLVIDELGDLLSGTPQKQRDCLKWLKQLGNELMIPIVGAGTRDAIRVLQSDPQVANRFEPAPVPRWKLDKDFQRLVASFERLLPLPEPSGLHKPRMVQRLHAMSEGTIGGLTKALEAAGTLAIRNGLDRIDETVLRDADHIPTSKSRAAAERVI
jgi:hypothetical protein